jgi:hypothetical protein
MEGAWYHAYRPLEVVLRKETTDEIRTEKCGRRQESQGHGQGLTKAQAARPSICH